MGVGSPFPGQLPPAPPETCKSFDGKWEAFIQDFNVFLKPDGKGEPVQLSSDGSERNFYSRPGTTTSEPNLKIRTLR
jgi:hypothetical protein